MRLYIGGLVVILASLVLVEAGRVKRDFGIYPGTKWCGIGNIADNEDDVAGGPGHDTDVCCRGHDHCQDVIQALQRHPTNGIFNPLPYRVSSCACDRKFLNCLKSNRDVTSDAVGHMYFNTLPTFCFTKGGLLNQMDYVKQVPEEEEK